MVRAWRKTRLKSCISKPVFLTAQQNSANTLHRQLEEEEGFGTDSRLQVLGWKRLDKILHCKQYNKLYFLQAAVPLARIISDHIHILADEQKCIDHFFFGSPAWHASFCQAQWEKQQIGWVFYWESDRNNLRFTFFSTYFKCEVEYPFLI